MQKDKDGKLTYKMTSPGEAWMNFVNSKEGHNASAVTPAYLEAKENDTKTDIEKKIDGAKIRKKEVEIDKNIQPRRDINDKEKR